MAKSPFESVLPVSSADVSPHSAGMELDATSELDRELAGEILASAQMGRAAFCAKFKPVLRNIA
eukprot:2774613-Pyramimonas_sp.AAC.1